ncbi:peptidase M56 [Flavobacterium amnicola]|uniref:Peptidase M56 n=1 Tax=Flavobacterium amnicola TaxID=2506422 RepID=A0A4Q1K662_9FLAO|nr:M56 family metallopeptidase [Flavobacterium amnicola]RXR19326.1 peptidase M56 [Flavobacterium amnicola]
MEAIFLFFLKASTLIGVYFLAYYLLLRKETFFTTNRWFLLAGLLTSVLMPLFFIKKVIWIERKEPTFNEMVQYSESGAAIPTPETFSIDWSQILIACYAIVVLFLIIKIAISLFSLFKLLNNKEVEKHDRFSLVDLNEDIAPFSFFNYIVYNSNYYTNDELRSILLHEKIHSQEKHSIDVMIAKLFCIVFWFNPFVWLYKKAMIQNLEYIADQKACIQIDDRKVYQKALLKAVTHQNCLSITNQFYQSLIKKRIVMLNKNQSHKKNSWKYTIVLPVLVAFFIAFQIKIIAQEKQNSTVDKVKVSSPTQNVTEMVWTKNSSDEELKRDIESMKKEGVNVSYSKLKRNSKGEITAIKVEFKDKNGKAGVNYVMSDEPIKPIYLRKTNDYIGFATSSKARIVSINKKDGKHEEEEYSFSFSDEDELAPIAPLADLEIPEPPVPPVYPYNNLMDAPNAPTFPRVPNAPRFPSDVHDEKSMAAFEKEMAVFEKKMKLAEKEFEAKMEIFEKEMNENDPKMKNFEKEMEKFEEAMEKYQERYQEQFQNRREIEIEKREAIRDAQREAQQEAAYARREAQQARKEAMKAREEALKDAEAARKDAIKERKNRE